MPFAGDRVMQPPRGISSASYLWRVLRILLAAGLFAGILFGVWKMTATPNFS
jgi:hypothetical protein